MGEKLSAEALDTLFMEARTYRTWEDRPVDAKMLEEIWNIARMGATSTNCSPARIVFVVSDEAKEKLKECLMDGNVEQTMKAPVTAIIGHDMEFYERLPELSPHNNARSWFAGNDGLIAETAFRNGTLQGAYLMLAARALGLGKATLGPYQNRPSLARRTLEFQRQTICRLVAEQQAPPDGPLTIKE